jgi:hypothetical protein
MPALFLTALMLVVSVAVAQPTTMAKQRADDAAMQAAQQAAAASKFVNPMPSTPASEQRDVMIRLERTPCYGNCPAYTVTILGDRSATFVAHDGRSTQKSQDRSCCDLVRKRTLSLADYNRLVAQIDAMGFFKLKNDYSAEVTDMPSVTIIVSTLNGLHSVRRYAVPCETQYRNGNHHRGTTTKVGSREIDIEPDYLAGITPPPDSLCKLESMIDRLSGADKWGEDTEFHWQGK